MKNLILILTGLLILPLSSNAQYFNVFDIDTTDYPTIRAKFYSIDEDGNQILDHTPADFEIKENGVEKEVVTINCPPALEDDIYSIAMSIDISGSMDN